MVKCDICKKEITDLVIGKIKGTFIKGKGKLFKICNVCQSKYSIAELKKTLKVK